MVMFWVKLVCIRNYSLLIFILCNVTKCGYEVPGMILLQAYPCTYSLLRGVAFDILPLSSYAVSQWCCHCLKHSWNLCCGIAFSTVNFFGCLQYPETFVPLGQTLFLETARSHLEPNQGNRVCVPFQSSIFGQATALWAGALPWWRIHALGQSSGLLLHAASCNHYNISPY